ncbi:unnamed protein product [Closterium sp. NIES-54]
MESHSTHASSPRTAQNRIPPMLTPLESHKIALYRPRLFFTAPNRTELPSIAPNRALEVLSVGAAATTRLEPAFVAGSGATSPTARLSFTLDSGASSCFFRDCTNLTPLHTPVTVALADPSVGSVVAKSTTTLPCPAAPSGFFTGYYTPSFSRNLVGVSHLHDLEVVTTFPLHEPVASCTLGATGAPLATFYREPGSSLSPRVTCPTSSLACAAVHSLRQGSTARCPSLLLVPPHHDSLADPALGCQERYFLVVVDDYSRYTTLFPLRRKADVPTVLEPWLLARGGIQGPCGLRLHSDRGVRYAAHQLNLWPSDARPRVTPIFLWTGFPGVAADYCIWGCLAHVRAPGANKLSARTCAYVFLGFPFDASGWVFYDPVTHQFFHFRRSSPPQRLVLVVFGGAGGAVAEGEGTGAAGARCASFGGARGVRVETTLEEDTAIST